MKPVSVDPRHDRPCGIAQFNRDYLAITRQVT